MSELVRLCDLLPDLRKSPAMDKLKAIAELTEEPDLEMKDFGTPATHGEVMEALYNHPFEEA